MVTVAKKFGVREGSLNEGANRLWYHLLFPLGCLCFGLLSFIFGVDGVMGFIVFHLVILKSL